MKQDKNNGRVIAIQLNEINCSLVVFTNSNEHIENGDYDINIDDILDEKYLDKVIEALTDYKNNLKNNTKIHVGEKCI